MNRNCGYSFNHSLYPPMSYSNRCYESTPSFPSCFPPETRLPVQLDPLFPSGTNRPKRKNPKNMIGKKNVTGGKKLIKKKTVPCDPCEELINNNNECNTKIDVHEDDCNCNECDDDKPNADCDSVKSTCSMSKSSQKNMSNFLYDNSSLKDLSCKKQSGCAEILDCLDEDSEVWILQCPKCFDVKKLLNSEIGKKSNKLEVSNDRFKSTPTLICLTPEKAAEYQSICDEIKLIRPVGKIMVTESQQQDCPQSCTDDEEEEDVEDECKAVDSLPLASKKIQKKVNDQRFTIETTVTVESVNDSPKKSKKHPIKQEVEESCLPLCPPEPQPVKRKKKC